MGLAQRALDEASKYSLERKTMGKYIAEVRNLPNNLTACLTACPPRWPSGLRPLAGNLEVPGSNPPVGGFSGYAILSKAS